MTALQFFLLCLTLHQIFLYVIELFDKKCTPSATRAGLVAVTMTITISTFVGMKGWY